MLEAALELYGGKAVLNSINFEDGEAAADGPHDARPQVRRGGDRADHRRGRHGQDRARTSCGSRAAWSTSPAAASACRSRDLLIDPLTFTICTGNEDDRKLGLVDAGGDRATSGASSPRPADHPGPVQRLLRPQPGRPPRAQLGDPRPRHAARPHRRHRPRQQDRAAAQDPARGGRGRRGPDLRPARATATTRCRRSWRCSPTARPTAGVAKARPETVEEQLKLRIVDGDKQGLEADLDEALEQLRAARHHQRHPARRHEGRGRAVRRRQDAAAVRAAVGRDDEEGGGLSRAA